MEDLGDNDMTSVWFNNRLFSSNGDPLKFYLEGYGPTEFHEIVRMIEAYGGELSSPDASDTFVFCETNHPVGVGKYDRYDIQYFQDSIIALHPQDLMKYKLRRSQNLESLSSRSEVRSRRSKTEEGNTDECVKSVKYELHETTVQPSTSSTKNNDETTDSHHDEIHREQKNNSKDDYCIDSCPSDTEPMQVKRNSYASTGTRIDVDYDADSDNNCQSSSEDDGDLHDSIVSQTPDDRGSSKSESNEKDSPVDHPLPDPTNSVKNKKGKGAGKHGEKGTPLTVEENETILKWLMEKNIIPPNTGQGVWERFLEEKVLPRLDVSAQTLLEHFHRELKEHPTFVNWIQNMKTSGREFDPAPKKDRKPPTFTEEENQTIIRWLMKKNVVPSNDAKSIWSKFLTEQILPHRNITLRSLQVHFKRELNKHPTFVQWIEDMKTTGREFNCLPSKKYKKYSEEENRIMIHHIIDHDAYHRASSENVWLELLISSKLSFHPDRTAFGLLQHFRGFLLKNFAKYTDDPEALKKFKEITLRRKLRIQNSERRIDLD